MKGNNPTTTTAAVKAKHDGSVPLTWRANEYVPRKRWWWFIGLTLIAAWLSVLASALQEWYVLAVVIAVTLVIFVTYLPKPRSQVWTLHPTTLTVDKTIIHLENYRAFTIEDLPAPKGTTPRASITLIPKRRLGWPFPVYLPEHQNLNQITSTLGAALPWIEAHSYQSSVRTLNRIARWLRLV